MDTNRQRQMSEMWKPVVKEFDDTVVSSGETRYYERMQNEWTKIVEELGEPFSIDDFSQIKFTQRKSCKQSDKEFIYRELTAYLQREKGYITQKESRQLLDCKIIEEGIKFNSKESEKIFVRVVRSIQQEFSDNKLPEDFQDEEDIRKLFYKLNERRLLDYMALGLNMTVKDVNFFLKKVLNNKELDDNIPDEYLLSIVLESKTEENISRYQQLTELKKYYAAMEMDDVGENSDENGDVRGQWLFQGEHCTEESINPDLRKLLRKYDKRHIGINQLVKRFKDIPTYQYVIRYLFNKMDFTDLKIDPEILFQYIRQSRPEATDTSNESGMVQEHFSVLFYSADCSGDRDLEPEKAFQELIRRVQERFKARELPDEFCEANYIEELILNLDEKKLLEPIAFGLDMTVDTVNIFLTKVLKHSELDYYVPEEYLLAIVLNNKKYDDKLKYPQYISLKNYYETMKVEAENSVIEPENTRSILSEEDIIFAETKELFSGEECTDESIHPKLKEMLAKHHLTRKKVHQAKNGKAVEFRTADKEFFDLMEKVQRRYSGKISMYKEVQGEMEDSELLSQRKSATGILRIQYEPHTEIELKKGFMFYRLDQKNPGNKIWFMLNQDVVLPARGSVKLTLPIRSITVKHEKAKEKKFVDKNTVFHVKDCIEGIISAKTGEKNRPHYYKVSKNKPDEGAIEVECKPGTVIAKGTRFTYTENNDVYEFESIEDMTAYISDDITVCCILLNKNGKMVNDRVRTTNYFMEIGKRIKQKTKNKTTTYYTLAESHTVCHMESVVDGVIKVWNPKPISYEQEGAAVINYQTEKFAPFCQYMYGGYQTDYFDQIFDEIDRELFLKEWFTSTEIKYETINEEKFSAKSNREKRNDILTLKFLIYVRECKLKDKVPQYLRFRSEVNETMQKCRLQRLYLGNPYDCLLTYLLAYDSPVDVLREIWAVVKNVNKSDQKNASF